MTASKQKRDFRTDPRHSPFWRDGETHSRSTELTDISAEHGTAADAVDFAIEFLSKLLSRKIFFVRPKSKAYQKCRRDLPYVIHGTSIEGTAVLVNRWYKPLGRPNGEHVVYEEYTNLHVCLTPEEIALVTNPGAIAALYRDRNCPWHSRASATEYLNRLNKLRSLL